jgi:bacterioferritin-associated ferredoxin
MATTLTAGPTELATPPAMTRCECACLSFEEVARRIETEGLTLPECARRTGCGQTCTACLPDLHAFLRRRDRRPPPALAPCIG